MFNYSSNIGDVLTIVSAKLENIDLKEMTALQASSVLGELRKRIHVDGKASDGSDIGSYSRGYLKVRSGLFESPTIVRGPNAGGSREKFNRGSQPKVILSLTRQMEGDMQLLPLDNGTGIGYSNAENFNKSQWAEKTYGKRVFSLTEREREIIQITGQIYVNDKINEG